MPVLQYAVDAFVHTYKLHMQIALQKQKNYLAVTLASL